MNRLFFKRLILQHTKLTRQHLTPELKLHLITPECPLWSAHIDNSPFEEPFWAFYWPGGQAITRYILDNPQLFEDRTILDVGSGCGSAALASALVGAKTVIANDIDLAALSAIELNMESNLPAGNIFLNGDNLLSTVQDIKADYILMGDMFYDPEFANLISSWSKSINFETTTLLIGDPGRLSFINQPFKQCLTQLAEYELSRASQLENSGFTHALVWRYNGMYAH